MLSQDPAGLGLLFEADRPSEALQDTVLPPPEYGKRGERRDDSQGCVAYRGVIGLLGLTPLGPPGAHDTLIGDIEGPGQGLILLG